MAQGILDLIENPGLLFELLKMAGEILADPLYIGTLVEQMAESAKESQREQNPFGDGKIDDVTQAISQGNIESFQDLKDESGGSLLSNENIHAIGWYVGYLVPYVVDIVYGTKGAMTTATKAKGAIKAAKATGSVRGAAKLAARSAGSAAKSRAMSVGRSLRAVGYSGSVAARKLATMPMGAYTRVSTLARQVDPETNRKLVTDGGMGPEMLSYLRLADETGVTLLNRIEDPSVAARLIDQGTPDSFQRSLREAAAHPDVSTEAVVGTVRKYDALPSEKRARFARVIDETGASGVRFSSRLSSGELKAALESVSYPRQLSEFIKSGDDSAALSAQFVKQARQRGVLAETLGDAPASKLGNYLERHSDAGGQPLALLTATPTASHSPRLRRAWLLRTSLVDHCSRSPSSVSASFRSLATRSPLS